MLQSPQSRTSATGTSLPDSISKAFRGKHGPACLFQFAMNIALREPEERNYTTGKHVAHAVCCGKCGKEIGLKYEDVDLGSEKWKVGTFLFEAES